MSAEPRDVFPLDSLQPWADTLIDVAESALDHGLAHGDPPTIDPAGHPEPLRARRAVYRYQTERLHNPAGRADGIEAGIRPERPSRAKWENECGFSIV